MIENGESSQQHEIGDPVNNTNRKRKKQNSSNIELQQLFRKYEINVDGERKWKANCLVQSCTASFSGKKVYNQNLYRHVFDHHHSLYEQIQAKYAPTEPVQKKKKISVLIDKDDIVRGCVLMVAKNGRPISALNDKGFRMILNPVLDGLKQSGVPLTINGNNIKRHISDYVAEFKAQVTREVIGRKVSVMIDTVTKHRTSIMGINIQYVINDDVITRTIGLPTILEKKSGANLSAIITNYLQQFGIKISQLHTLTTDNAPNMLCTARC